MKLPTMRCERRAFPAVAADPGAEVWRGLPAQFLRETVTSAAPRQTTVLKIGRSESDLRVLFEVTDNNGWATHTQRDAPLYEEEVVEVFLDPVGDLESYFEIEVNPLNTVLDLVLRKSRSGYVQDIAWRCEGMRTAVTRNPAGWCAELSIPFASLVPAIPKAGTQWRANFYRIDRPTGEPRELSAWSPTGRPNFHTPERFGILEFVA